MKRVVSGPLLATLALAACSADDLGPPSVVDSLRVLAVRADLPIAEPGERVHLDALVADPHGGGRAVTLAWSTCANPGSPEVPDCAAVAAPFAVGGASFDVTVSAGALDDRPSDLPIGIVGVLFAACAGDVVLERTATAPVRCVRDGRDVGREGFMWGEKRIVVARGVRNANPKIADVRFDGAPWDPAAPPPVQRCDGKTFDDCADQHDLALTATPDSAETLAGVTEDLVAFWFVSDGRVADDFVRAGGGAFTTKLDAPGVAVGTAATVWLVLRDDRGGVDWQLRGYVAR